MKICIINFSGRAGGNGHGIAAFTAGELTGTGGLMNTCETEIIEFSGLTVQGCGSCSYECFRRGQACTHRGDDMWNVYMRTADADMCCFIIPNYNGHPCSNFYSFEERGQGIYLHARDTYEKYLSVPKKFIVISNTDASHFKLAFENCLAKDKEADILFLRAAEFHLPSTGSELISCVDARRKISRFLAEHFPL